MYNLVTFFNKVWDMRRISTWAKFAKDPNYKLVDLGRPAIFLIPEKKLRIKIGGQTIETILHNFLSEKFGAFTSSIVANFGIWVNDKNVVHKDRCRIYEVSFEGKGRIPILLRKLAEMARLTDEECIYLKAGQYSCLVYPKSLKR